MKIAVIGTGSVGGTLGRGWARAGHEVVFGTRDPGQADVARLTAESGARAAAVAEAAAGAEVVALAVPWGAVRDALRQAGGLQGKIVLDCTNPLKPDLSGLDIGSSAASAAEQVAAWAPGARVVKIFNSTGFNNMADPRYPEGPAAMLYCGDDAAAKEAAGRLAVDLGFEPIDAGPLAEAPLLEALALLWIHLAYRQQLGREIAFRLMRR